ncbi:MAG: ABC transporter permease [Burkholderiales bacterium]|nr:ABC transporter permease [Burkholderiales bacterium]
MPASSSHEMTVPDRTTQRLAQLSAVVRFTMLEAWRSKLPWLLLLALGCTLAASQLAAELAITEGGRFRAALLAGGVRFAWVFIFAVYVIGSLTRELNERGFEVALALELDRSTWVAGKLAGFLLPAFAAALCLFPLLATMAPPAAAAAWCLSLAFELSVVIAAALFFTLNLASVPAAAVLTAGFYLLARTIDALVLIASASPLIVAGAWRDFARMTVDALAWLLPPLGRFTQGSWLAGQVPDASLLGLMAAQSAVYVVLLGAAALVDFHRRDL